MVTDICGLVRRPSGAGGDPGPEIGGIAVCADAAFPSLTFGVLLGLERG